MHFSDGIKAIFYDLDGTLRLNNPNGWQAFADYAVSLGAPVSGMDRLRVARWEHYYFAESPELVSDRTAFTASDAFWLNYNHRQLQVLGANSEQAAELAPHIHKLMREDYKPQDIIPTDLPATLQTLKEKGYFLGVMSNRFEPYNDYLAQKGIESYFDMIMYAGEAGVRKPRPEVFHFMLKKAGSSAEASVYVGDNYFADALGARSAGLQPVLFDTQNLFERPECPVITAHGQILKFLNGNKPA
jgi:HAD superfamily hydrolase (TIGR01549 family)